MTYQIQVEVEERAKCGHGTVKVFKPSCRSNGQPYEYSTAEEAIKISRMCYPDNLDQVKIVKI